MRQRLAVQRSILKEIRSGRVRAEKEYLQP